MNRVFVSHPVKHFSGSKEPITELLARALDALWESGAADVDHVLIVAAHPYELAGVEADELAAAGARHLESRGVSAPVEFFANPSIYVEKAHLAASASGAALFHEGARRVASGECRSIALVGLEQMRITDRTNTTRALRSLIHEEEKKVGLTMPALGALLERALTSVFPGLGGALQELTFANRFLAESNPRAHIRKRFNRADAGSDRNPMIADPLRLWGVAPTSTGFAGLVLSRQPSESQSVQVEVAGIGSGLDRVAISRRESLSTSRATRQAMAEVATSLGREPAEIAAMLSYAEVHDAFPIIEFLGLGDCSLAGTGNPVEAIQRGEFLPSGRLPVNLSGGVMGGHPLGATGIGQIVELHLQATGSAETRIPLEYPHYSLAFNVGGALTYNFVTLLAVSRKAESVGPFRLSLRPPFVRDDLDLSFDVALSGDEPARVASFTRLYVPPPGFESPWTIALVDGDGGCDFAVADGQPLAQGDEVRIQRLPDGSFEILQQD